MELVNLEILLGVAVGVGLSAACGFRVFVPLLVMGLGARTGHLSLAPSFEWVATSPALIAFGVATLVEVVGNAVPGVGSAVNGLAAPAAVVAGTVTTAACVTDVDPFLHWSLAIIAGGGTAGVVHGASMLVRLPGHAAIPGLADTAASVVEAVGSVVLSLIAIVLPLLALCAVAVLLLVLAWFAKRLYRRWRPAKAATG